MSEERIFLLSPANLNGKRGKMLLDVASKLQLAQALRSPQGAALGDVFSFVSSLYFRGKAAYAAKFARPPSGAWVMTPGGGLCRLDERMSRTRLEGWQRVLVNENNPHFTAPLVRHVSTLVDTVNEETKFVLLGSVASRKYVVPLLDLLGSRLLYPSRFAGLGDMSRGALLLRCVREGTELSYAAVRPEHG